MVSGVDQGVDAVAITRLNTPSKRRSDSGEVAPQVPRGLDTYNDLMVLYLRCWRRGG